MPTIQGTLAYVCIQKPVPDFKKIKKEYKVTVVVDEDTADTWNETFAKQPAKVIKTADFEDHFKFAPPFPKEKKHYYIDLRQSELWPDGKARTDKDRPKVFLNTGENADGKAMLKDITETTLVANGSVGVVSYTTNETKDYGTIAYLKNIRVDKLVEYIPKVVEEDDEDFGVVVDEPEDDFDDEPEVKSKIASKKVQEPAKEAVKESKVKSARVKREEPEDDLEDSPF